MLNPYIDASFNPDLDPSIEDNYDGLPIGQMIITTTCDCFHCTGIVAEPEPINTYEEDYAL